MKRLVATALVALMLASLPGSTERLCDKWRSDRQDGRESLSQVLPE